MALKVLSMGAKAKPHFSLPISSQAKILTDDDDDDDEKNNETVSLILAPY